MASFFRFRPVERWLFIENWYWKTFRWLCFISTENQFQIFNKNFKNGFTSKARKLPENFICCLEIKEIEILLPFWWLNKVSEKPFAVVFSFVTYTTHLMRCQNLFRKLSRSAILHRTHTNLPRCATILGRAKIYSPEGFSWLRKFE